MPAKAGGEMAATSRAGGREVTDGHSFGFIILETTTLAPKKYRRFLSF